GLRPVSDVVVKLDSFIRPFQFGDTNISLFRQLLIQTQVLAARYRTGDGTGVAGVTPATSCVQDSNQALFIAIQQVRQQIENDPALVEWVQQNPDSPEAQQAQQFVALAEDLEALLTPYGVIRPDWQNNAESLAGIGARGDFSNNKGLFSGALSWQTMMPRWGHDAVARTFLQHGGQLWFLRPNMLGGNAPRIEPIPPTSLFGGIPVLGRGAQRFADAFATGAPGHWILLTVGLLAIYGAIAIPWGLKNGILVRQNAFGNPLGMIFNILRLWFVPALVEEVIFRVMLLPHPVEGVPVWRWLVWAAISLVLFVLYHWLLGKTFYKAAAATFCDRRFLILVGWAGLLLTILYGVSGSLWLIVFAHWAIVLVWIYALGGKARLPGRKPAKRLPPNPKPTH
ncbi:MAG: CPBP family glutamic-type intramembrane protease, partial [Cyanobacteria bacterium J06638_6]